MTLEYVRHRAQNGVDKSQHEPPRGDNEDRLMAAAATFERVVRDAMEREGLTLLSLAQASGVKRTQLYTYFNGTHVPNRRTLERVAGPLGLRVDELAEVWPTSVPKQPRSGIVTDPGLGRLTDAINRLAEVLEGRWRVLDELVEEGIDADPDPAPADPRPPASMHRRPPDAT